MAAFVVVDESDQKVLGRAESRNGVVTSSGLAVGMIAGRVKGGGYSDQEAFDFYAGGWSNGYTTTRPAGEPAVTASLLTHLPGLHDQSTHGRRYPGGRPARTPSIKPPKPPARSPAVRRADQVQAARLHLDKIVKVDKPPDIAGGIRAKIRVSLQIRDGLIRQAELTPKTAMTLTSVGSQDWWDFTLDLQNVNAAYHGTDRNIGLSPMWSQRPERMQEASDFSRQAGYHTPNGVDSGVASTVAHEFGHHVMRQIYDWTPAGGADEGPSAGMPMPLAKRLMRVTSRALGVPEPDYSREPDAAVLSDRGLDRWYLRAKLEILDKVSGYAGNDGLQELFAEVWREYSTMGDRARPHIKQIGRAMAREAERNAS